MSHFTRILQARTEHVQAQLRPLLDRSKVLLVLEGGVGLFGVLKARNLLIPGRHRAHGTHQAPYLCYTAVTRA